MGLRPSSQNCNNMVQKYVGTAYDNVKVVADNIDDVIYTADTLQGFENLTQDITEVANNIDDIEVVATNISNVNEVAGNTSDLINISNNMLDVNNVSESIPNVNKVSSDITSVNTLSTNIDSVLTVEQNLPDIRFANDNITDIQKTKEDMADINTFVESSQDDFIDNTGSTRKTLTGIENVTDLTISTFNSEAAAAILEMNKSRGFRVVGTFVDGFTYELFNDVGIDADGNSWIYIGTGVPNKVVTAGTVPSAPDYEQVTSNRDVDRLIWGDRYRGAFYQGFTYTSDLDVGLNSDGKYYKYIGSDPYPVTVPVGTNASDFSLVYQRIDATSHSALSGKDALGAHDSIYKREFVDVEDMINAGLPDSYEGSIVATKSYSTSSGEGGADYILMTTTNATSKGYTWWESGSIDGYFAFKVSDNLVAVYKDVVLKYSSFTGTFRKGNSNSPDFLNDFFLAGWQYGFDLDFDLGQGGSFNTNTPIKTPDTTWSGRIYGRLLINAGGSFPNDQTLFWLRNFKGTLDASVYANGFRRCRTALRLSNAGGMVSRKLFRGRRGLLWGIQIDNAGGNSNSMVFSGKIRAEISGENLKTPFTESSSSSLKSKINIAGFDDTLDIVDYLVEIGGDYYSIDSMDSANGTVVIEPALTARSKLESEATVYVGGGIKTRGSDTGVCTIDGIVAQANEGVGYRAASLYGQTINLFVGEINKGPSIVIGAGGGAANLKNVFLDSYFEGGPTERVVIVSGNAEVNFVSEFNLRRKGVYISNVGSGEYYNVSIPEVKRKPGSYSQKKSDATTSISLTNSSQECFKSANIHTADVNVSLKLQERNNKSAKLYIQDCPNRSFIITDIDGVLVNGEESVTLESPEDGMYEFTYFYGSWIMTFMPKVGV